jgi:O-antigen ligase
MALLLAVVLALIPLAIAPGCFFYFDVTPKTVLLLLGTAAATLWWAAADTCWTAAGLYRASRAARWFLLALCGMAVLLVVSTLASVNPALSLGGSNWRYWGLVTQLAALGFAYLVAVCCAGRPGRLRVLLRAIAVSGLIVSLYGIAQYLGWDPLLDARGYHVGEGIWAIVRPPSTLGHADYSANWLVFVVFAGAALRVSETRTSRRWFGWVCVVAGCVAIVLSGTRAAMIGLVAGAFALILVPRWRLKPAPGDRRSAVAAGMSACATIALATIFYFSPAGAKVRARVHWARDEPAGGARILLWRDSLRMAAARWPVGYGPETFIATFARHQSAELGRAYPDFYHESPHNMFLDVLASEGVAGPVLLLALAASGFAAGWSLRRNPAAVALAAGLAAMTISEQFASFTLPTALAYYAAIAMLVSLGVGAVPPSHPVSGRWARLAVAVPCAAILVFFAVRLAIAETLLTAVRRDLDARLVDDAATRYAEYLRWRWPSPSADLWYSRRLAQIAGSNAAPAVQIQAFHQAGVAAQRAPQTTEAAFNAYYNLAAFYARENDFSRTEQSLRAAIDRAPNWFKTHWMLAQVLAARLRLNEAETEAATAVALDGGKHPEVTATLERIRAALRAASIEPPHK